MRSTQKKHKNLRTLKPYFHMTFIWRAFWSLCCVKKEKNLRKNVESKKQKKELSHRWAEWVAHGDRKRELEMERERASGRYWLRISIWTWYPVITHETNLWWTTISCWFSLFLFYCPLANDTKWPSHNTHAHINWYACVQFFNGATQLTKNISIANPQVICM